MYDLVLYNITTSDGASVLMECQRDITDQLLSDIKRFKIRKKVNTTVISVSDCRSMGHEPGHITFLKVDHKIISVAVLPSTDSRRQLSVTGKSMCTKYWLAT